MSACSSASASATRPSRSSAATGRASCRRNIWSDGLSDARAPTKKPAPHAGTGFPLVSAERTLRRQDGDDFPRVRINDQELIADQNILEATVFRNDGHDLGRQYRDVNVSRYSRADAHGEVRTIDPRHIAIADNDVLDLGALVLRELNRSATGMAASAVLLRLARDRLAAILVLLAAILVLAHALFRPGRTGLAGLVALSATLVLRAALLLGAALRCRRLIAFLLGEALALRAGSLRSGCRRFALRAAAGRSAHCAAWIAHLMLLGALGLHRAALCAGILRYSK